MIMSSQCICDIVSVCVPHFLAWNNWSMFSECESNLFNFFYKGGPLRRGIGRKSSSSREFSPRVSEVMSLSDTKLQCLLCYKKFSTKEESTAHMMTRHRITLDIDKSMRSVYAWSVRWKLQAEKLKFGDKMFLPRPHATMECKIWIFSRVHTIISIYLIVRKTLLVVSFNVCLVEINCFSWIWQKSIFRWWYEIWGGGAESTATKGEGDAPKIQLCLEMRCL